MATKRFVKQFNADFDGVNTECAAIEYEGSELSEALNYEFAVSNSLRGRAGFQAAAEFGDFFGLFTHIWSRTTDQYELGYNANGRVATKYIADGASKSQVVALGRYLWTLAVMNVSLTYGGPWPIYKNI